MDRLQILLKSANAFERVARHVNSEGMDLESHSLIIASSVNAALSLEYFAKCLVFAHCGKYKKSHNLEDILSDLPSGLHDQLAREYKAALTDEEINRARMASGSAGVPIETDFDSAVKNWSRVFVKGRYWFEVGSGNVQELHWFFFDPLVTAFRAVIAHTSKSAT